MDVNASDWSEEIAEMEVGRLEPDEITANMFADMLNRPISHDNAAHKLRILFEKGRVTRRFVLVDGKKVYAYRKVKK